MAGLDTATIFMIAGIAIIEGESDTGAGGGATGGAANNSGCAASMI